jgi:hypothetical protein
MRIFDLLPESNNQLYAATIGSKQRKIRAGSSKQQQAASRAGSRKQQQAASSSGKQQQAASSSGKEQQAAAISGKEQQAAAPDEGWKFVRSAFGVALRNSIINTFSRQIRKFSQTPHIQVRVHCRRITHMYIKTKIKFHLLATILEGRAS